MRELGGESVQVRGSCELPTANYIQYYCCNVANGTNGIDNFGICDMLNASLQTAKQSALKRSFHEGIGEYLFRACWHLEAVASQPLANSTEPFFLTDISIAEGPW